MNQQTLAEILIDLINGGAFSFPSKRKPGRSYTIKIIKRDRPMTDLFIVTAPDLKRAAGIYNEENISTVIERHLSGKEQSSFHLR